MPETNQIFYPLKKGRLFKVPEYSIKFMKLQVPRNIITYHHNISSYANLTDHLPGHPFLPLLRPKIGDPNKVPARALAADHEVPSGQMPWSRVTFPHGSIFSAMSTYPTHGMSSCNDGKLSYVSVPKRNMNRRCFPYCFHYIKEVVSWKQSVYFLSLPINRTCCLCSIQTCLSNK